MSKDWECVYSAAKMVNAIYIKELLEENGIEAFIINKKDSVFSPIGEIEIMVEKENLLNAKHLLKSNNIE